MKLSSLTPDQRNANKGTARGRKLVRESLQKYGAGRSILLDRAGNIIAGNKTAEGAEAIGMEDVLVVKSDGTKLVAVQRTDLDINDPKARELAIADNRASELGLDWDIDVLKQFETEQVDLTPFWDEKELVTFFARAGDGSDAPEPRIDQAAALQRKWGTQTGQVWLIGQHRILCGDGTTDAGIAALWGTAPQVLAKMAFTDPPWNVAIGLDKNPRHRQRPGLENDSLPEGEFDAFLDRAAKVLLKQVEGDIYVVLGSATWPNLDCALRGAGFHWSSTIIWVKDIFVLGRSKYHRRYEPIWYGWAEKSSYVGDRAQDDVWEIARPRKSEEHPTMKPPELVARAIANSSEPGDIVFDGFLGSGTTMVAAHAGKRICYGAEIDPGYTAVVLQRMLDMGEQPVLEHGR